MKAESENINGIYQKAENNWSRLLIRLVTTKLVHLTNISCVGKGKKKKEHSWSPYSSQVKCVNSCVYIHAYLHTRVIQVTLNKLAINSTTDKRHLAIRVVFSSLKYLRQPKTSKLNKRLLIQKDDKVDRPHLKVSLNPHSQQH